MSLDLQGLEYKGFSFARNVSADDLLHIAESLGNIRFDPRSPQLVRDIRPQPLSSAKENTLSSRYGTGAFPFHTDTAHWTNPARHLALYCVHPGEGKRTTLLQDTRCWDLDEDETELACGALWKAGHLRPRLCTLAERTDRGFAIRYDMDCMRPMTKEAQKLKSLVDTWIARSAKIEIDWEPKSLLVIDNQRLVHARGATNKADTNRVLKRILIGGV